jgi:hypothetical protein
MRFTPSMKEKFIIASFSLLPVMVFSQTPAFNSSENEKKIYSHASQVQLEALGPGGLLSFHFDSRFKKAVNGIGYTVGLGFAAYGLFEESCNSGGVVTIPVGLNYLFGKNHFFEVGAGGALKFGGGTKVYCLYIEDSFFENEESFYAYALLGYRYQPNFKRITFRAFISPLFQKDVPVKFWGGASIGLQLN